MGNTFWEPLDSIIGAIIIAGGSLFWVLMMFSDPCNCWMVKYAVAWLYMIVFALLGKEACRDVRKDG